MSWADILEDEFGGACWVGHWQRVGLRIGLINYIVFLRCSFHLAHHVTLPHGRDRVISHD